MEDFGHFLRHDPGDYIGAAAGGKTDGQSPEQARQARCPHGDFLPRGPLGPILPRAYRF
jgi:hypothetical protein